MSDSALSPRRNYSPRQVRAARALLGWSVEMLAIRAGLEPEAVDLYEAGEAALGDGELGALAYALSDLGGVTAIPARLAGEGVRLRSCDTLHGEPR